MTGHLGQRCPGCGILMDLRQTLSQANEKQYALVCLSHGRHTAWYLSSDDALMAPVVKKPAMHQPPLSAGSVPPREPVVVQEPRNASELANQQMQELAARTGEAL